MLKGKVAVITGGTRGIGFATVKKFLENGAAVVLFGSRQETVDKALAALKEENPDWPVSGAWPDLGSEEAVAAELEKIRATHGKIDILINGAGGNNAKANTDKEYYEAGDLENPELKSFFDLDPNGVSFVFNLNFLGTLLPTQEFAKDMIGREGCSIINISSMNAFTPLTKIPAYSGAKAAVSNFTQWLAVHFAKVGIRCNAIAPGFFVTAQNQKLLFNDDGTPTARTGKILNNTPTARFGKPEELIGAVIFLASEQASSFVNGVVLPIDGGFNAYSGV